jgi:hypothetical protein
MATRVAGTRRRNVLALYPQLFVGVHFLRKRKPSLLGGVGEDATLVAGQIAALGG